MYTPYSMLVYYIPTALTNRKGPQSHHMVWYVCHKSTIPHLSNLRSPLDQMQVSPPPFGQTLWLPNDSAEISHLISRCHGHQQQVFSHMIGDWARPPTVGSFNHMVT